MSRKPPKTLSIFAPAKINLFLHVTGLLDNGYHTLDSLVSFVDIGDKIIIEPASEFSFGIKGPYVNGFVAREIDSSPDSSNFVVRAVWSYSKKVQKVPDFRVTLIKNLPLASGLGGGSADAAAVIWGMSEWWGRSQRAAASHYLPELLLSLGADVPVCMECKAARMQGIGDILQPAPLMSELSVVLARPAKFCPTKDVFAEYNGTFKEHINIPEELISFIDVVDFLSKQENDLTDAAIKIVPDIKIVLETLRAQDGCGFARMSGSGATCFGLFNDEDEALLAAECIMQDNPEWWVRSGILNRTERY